MPRTLSVRQLLSGGEARSLVALSRSSLESSKKTNAAVAAQAKGRHFGTRGPLFGTARQMCFHNRQKI